MTVTETDAFDLPDWLGTGTVVWTAAGPVRAPDVRGDLADESGAEQLPCDLLAVDLAFPKPVLDDTWRSAAHRAWSQGQVLLLDRDGRLTLAVPGVGFTADLVLEALSRLALAVGVKPDRVRAVLRP